MNRAIPDWVWAVTSALHLRRPDLQPLRLLDDAAWRAVLSFCDRQRITLVLGRRANEAMPGWVRERIAANRIGNARRTGQLLELYRMLNATLAGIDFAVLKGVTQTRLTGERPEDRVQYDIDLYALRDSALAARDRLLRCGFESRSEYENLPTDHLAPMVRNSPWEWRGDYFDQEIPISIELHFRFWNRDWERLDAADAEAFWVRRVTCPLGDLELSALHPADAVGYTALHLLRHLLRGDVTVGQVYELAVMLDRAADNQELWARWQEWHAPRLKQLEVVAFQLAREWFGCRMGPVGELDPAAASWFHSFAFSPLANQFRPNKDELWLHWSLLETAGDRWRVGRQRLLPSRLPGPVDGADTQKLGWTRRWRKRLRYAAYLAGRVWRHAVALPRTAVSGLRFWLTVAGRSTGERCP
jgi:hypothetical protein